MSIELRITRDNRNKLIEEVNQNILRALEIVGGKAETYAKNNITSKKIVDTGALRNSMSHSVDEQKKQVHIGTPLDYGIYNELGTGIHYEGGRRTSWVFQDSKGDWHKTDGMKPRPFLKPAIEEHIDEYKKIIETELNNL